MIYLDYAATTPIDKRVLEAMQPYLTEVFANPSSLHQLGQRARRGLETAREQVAAAINASAKEIVFTSGATEAINQVLKGLAAQYPKGHIVTSQLEHKAVLATCGFLEAQGIAVTYLAPNGLGEITPEAVEAALQDTTFVVALMLINNETGVRTNIAEIANLTYETNCLLFCDGVQAFGHEPVDVKTLNVDFMSLSAHKLYGPKGVGALYVKEGLEPSPFMLGGEQERGFRAGTHNLASIVGMGAAAALAQENAQNRLKAIADLRGYFEGQLKTIEGIDLNGAKAPRGSKHSNVQVKGVDGEALLLNLDTLGVAASAGSACAAGSLEPSHVLVAMGLTKEEAKASIRFSFGEGITKAHIDKAVLRFKEAVERCRVFA